MKPVAQHPACNACKAEGLKEAYTFPAKPEVCLCLACAKPAPEDLTKVMVSEEEAAHYHARRCSDRAHR